MLFQTLSLKYLKSRLLQPSTLNNYRRELEIYIWPIIAHIPISHFVLQDLENLNRNLTNVSTNYRCDMLTLVATIFKWACKVHLLNTHPCADFKYPTREKPKTETWTWEDTNHFLNWLDQKKIRNAEAVKDLVLISLHTGLTRGKIGGLKPEDIDLNKNLITVQRYYNHRNDELIKLPTTQNISFTADIKPILKKAALKPNLIFNTRTNALKMFGRTCQQAGLPKIKFNKLNQVFVRVEQLNNILD